MTRWRKVIGATVACALLGSACDGRALTVGADAGRDVRDFVAAHWIGVNGTAGIHPAAAAWMNDVGLAQPSLDGLTLRLEEPFRMALEDPSGVFGRTTLTAGSEFSIRDVNAALVSRGIAAAVIDERDPGVSPIIPASTVVWDAQLQQGSPRADLTGARAWAIPLQFHDQLTAAITAAQIQALTLNSARSLIDAGFMLGRVVDAQGRPMAGARIETDPPAWADRVFYPSGDLRTVTATGTQANGLFVIVHTGGLVEPFAFRVKERAEYGWRNGEMVSGLGRVVTVHPGTSPVP